MTRIRLPHNWKPRKYQLPAWSYMENGGKHAELIWHRRSGKDEIALHRTACAAFERVATYWHMLPEAAQARKAIWEAINPHTGKRRIDEVFPQEIRANTREQEMMIRFQSGSTWQVVGSDNYNSLVGSPPAGVVYSEWALNNPASRAYLRPILAENNGWQMFITTPRGKNHAHTTYNAAKKQPNSFAQILTARDTGIFSVAQLDAEKQSYIDDFGLEMGTALFEQEFMCSFEAAILGAYYGGEISAADQAGRIRHVPHDPALPVYTAWDLGYSDDTSIWFYQTLPKEIHIIDFYSANGKNLKHYLEQICGQTIETADDELFSHKVKVKFGEEIEGIKHRTKYKYATHWLPHDAKAKTLSSGGKSIQEMLSNVLGWGDVRIVPSLSLQDGIQATRAILPKCWFDEENTSDGVEALRQYRREWDDKKKVFVNTPLHNWASHPSDAFRMLAIAWKSAAGLVLVPEKAKGKNDYWIEEDEESADSWKTA